MKRKAVRTVLGLWAVVGWVSAAWAQNYTYKLLSHGEKRHIIVFRSTGDETGKGKLCEQYGGAVVRPLEIINALVVDFPASRTKTIQDALRGNGDILRVEEDRRIKWIETRSEGAVALSPIPVGSGSGATGGFELNRAVLDGLSVIPLPSLTEVIQPFKGGGGAPLRGTDVLGDAALAPLRAAPPAKPRYPWGIERVKADQMWRRAQGAGVKVAIIDTGIDLAHSDLASNIAGGYNAQKPEASAQDDNGHGTHVAGTVAAVWKEYGVVGVAPKARLYAVKVLDSDGSGSFSDVIAGIDWAAKNKMQVANMSLGAGFGTESLKEAVQNAHKAGVTIVAAAGNDMGGSVSFPAAYPETIAVSASDNQDKFADFSSKGPEVDFVAPGVDVESVKLGGGYVTYSGTSMATPHVTGLAALAVSRGSRGSRGIRAAFQRAAQPLPGLSSEQQGAGLINATNLRRGLFWSEDLALAQ